MTLLTLVPARSGSKGLPGKNIKPLCGKPLLGWTIEAALESGVPMRLVVSTDSAAYAEVGRRFGAEVPFLRPEELAADTTGTLDVLWHLVDWYATRGEVFDAICILQPTSPFRTSLDIKEAWNLFVSRDASSVVSVCEMDHSPLWANTIDETLSLDGFLREEIKGKRRQELPTHYRLNGAIYLAKTELLRERESFFGPGSLAHIMPRERSLDIDTGLDFEIAEVLGGKPGKGAQ